MKGSTSQRTGGQRGSALLLVLAALSVGSMIIVPTIDYVYSGIVRADIAEDSIYEQYAADAAIEYGLWQLKYDVNALMEQLAEGDSTTSTTVNGIEIPIVIGVTESPLGEDWPFPIPVAESGIHLTTFLLLGPPVLSEDGLTSFFPHRVYMFNSGTSSIHMGALFQQLDPRLVYLPDSYIGPDAVFTEDYVVDHWELYFEFTTPLPKLDEGHATYIEFLAETTEEMERDTYVGGGWVSYSAFGSDQEETFTGEWEPGSIGAYFDVTVSAGSYTIVASVGITEDGEIVILSYQIQ